MTAARVFYTTKVHLFHRGSADHNHGPRCGHESINHSGQHIDYLVDGHAHHAHEGHWDECDPTDLDSQRR
jgi:hypothetical protein